MNAEQKKKFLARMARGRKAAASKGAPAMKKSKSTKSKSTKSKSKSTKHTMTMKALSAKVHSMDRRLDVVEVNDSANQGMWKEAVNSYAKANGQKPIKSLTSFGFTAPRKGVGYGTRTKQLGAGKR